MTFVRDLMTATLPLNGGELLEIEQNGASRKMNLAAAFTSLGNDTVSVKKFGALGNGVSDDSAAFAAAIATGKRVLVPATTTAYLVDNVVIPTGTTLYGEGAGSKIKPFTVGAAYVLQLAGSGNDIEIYGLNFDVNIATYAAKIVIFGNLNARARIHDCTFPAGGGYTIRLDNATDCTIQRVSITNAAWCAIQLAGVANSQCKILDSTVGMAGGALAAIEINNGTLCQVLGCSVIGAGIFGYHLDTCTKSLISNCSAQNTTREGYNLEDSTYCTVSNCSATWVGGISIDFGMSIFAYTVPSSYNTITGCTIVSPYKSGICIDGSLFAASKNHITGNRIENCNIENVASGAGVLVYGAYCDNNQITDNVITDTIGKLKFGVNEASTPTNTRVRNNLVVNPATAIATRAASGINAINGMPMTPWVPAVVPGSGAITAVGAKNCWYYELEKMVYIEVDVTITTNGTGGVFVAISLPFSAGPAYTVIPGREAGATGVMIQGTIAPASNQLSVTKYDATYPGGSGYRLHLSGWYERN